MREYNAMKSTREIFYKLKHLSRKWENYFDVYDKILPQYVGKKPNMLEIGVAKGGSTEMWIKYFDNEINMFCVDIDKACLDYKYDGVTVDAACLDQSDPEQWDAYLKNKPKFDIIIDDGGHEMVQQIVTLNKLFPYLADGGTMIIEDTHTSYWDQWGGGFKRETSFIEYVKNLIDLQHAPFINAAPPPEVIAIFAGLKSVTFYNSMVILEKGPTRPAVEADSAKLKNPNFEWN